jgi:dipeptidyl aminopeptidase/acylaminoacyl peptidase
MARRTPPARPLDVETLLALQRLGPPTLSPDGRAAVCTVTTPSLADNRSTTRLWWLPADASGGAPRPLTQAGEKDGAPAWSPRGDRIAFVARRDQGGRKDDTPQLYCIAADGGEAVRVSDFAPGVESFRWWPDGERIVFAAWVQPELKGTAAQVRAHKARSERKESGYATDEAYYRYWDHNVPAGRVLHLHLLELKTGRIVDLFEGTTFELPRDAEGNSVYGPHPDGRSLVFAHDPAPVAVLDNPLALTRLELKARRFKTLLKDARWSFHAPSHGPDGALAFVAQEVGRHHMALPQPALLDVTPGATWRPLAPDWDLDAQAPLRWTADGQALLFTAESQGRCHLWRLPRQGGLPQVIHEGGWVQGFDVAGERIAVSADSATHPARISVFDADGATRRIESFNDTALDGVALGTQREVQITGANGEPVQMWLTLPPGFDARSKRKWPLLHLIHGGPYTAAGDAFSYRWNAQAFAAWGYVVAQVNFHGSSGFGFEFRRSLHGRQGQLECADIEAATDWLSRQRWIDRRRLFASGGSYGGFLVAWMNGHVPAGRYRAYVCHAGVFDRVATFAADSYPERPRDLDARWWLDMDRVLAQSPHASAAKMATPTLVIHGALDYRVPDCNGLAYYNTLKTLGVPARLLWFPDENHWVLKPANAQQWYREFRSWLRRHDTVADRGGDRVPAKPG